MPGLETPSGALLHDPKHPVHNQQIVLETRHLVTFRPEETLPESVPALHPDRSQPMRFLLFNVLTFVSSALALAVLVEVVSRLTQARLEAQAILQPFGPREAARRAYEEAPTLS